MHSPLQIDWVWGGYFVFTVYPPLPFESISISQMELGSQGRAGEGMDSPAVNGAPLLTMLLCCRGPNPSKLIQQFLTLRPDQQLHIFNTLKAHLVDRGILGSLEDA